MIEHTTLLLLIASLTQEKWSPRPLVGTNSTTATYLRHIHGRESVTDEQCGPLIQVGTSRPFLPSPNPLRLPLNLLLLFFFFFLWLFPCVCVPVCKATEDGSLRTTAAVSTCTPSGLGPWECDLLCSVSACDIDIGVMNRFYYMRLGGSGTRRGRQPLP